VRQLLAFVALGALGAVAACASIEGLDGFSKGDCSGGGACEGGLSADAAPGDGTVDALPEASGDDGAGDGAAADAQEGGDGSGTDAAPGADAGHDAPADAPRDASDGGTPGDGAAGDGATGDGAATDGAPDASDAASEAEAGCGPLTSTSNCGGCGIACTPTWATGDSCNGLTCSYTCQSGHSDCNAGVGSNVDGCECATPGCCAGACQTSHTNGVGQTYYDCNPVSTFGVVEATEACTAWAISAGGTAADCADGYSCNNKAPYQVCFTNASGCQDYCWGYSGSQGGVVYTCSCPNATAGSWN
jgi:hypothetical protein